MIPFPHILETPSIRNDYRIRIVSDIPVSVGSVLTCKDRKQSYRIGEVILQRPARGDWSAYPAHPFYFECYGSIYVEPKEPLETNEIPESHDLKQKQVFPV